MRKCIKTTVTTDLKVFKEKLLAWGGKHETTSWLDSNSGREDYKSFDALLAVGVVSSLSCNITNQAFDKLSVYQKEAKDWLFGFLTYDLKNDVETLESTNQDHLNFPALYFFQPKKILRLRGRRLEQFYAYEIFHEAESDLKSIQNQSVISESPARSLSIQARLKKADYLLKVEKMQEYIQQGAVYEANFCQEFYANGSIDPLTTFAKLNEISRAPFATYFKSNGMYLLCTSPERYLKKINNKVISQPIKGTARRSKDVVEDKKSAEELRMNKKERSENIMITDLVRNDLSRIAQKGSVTVEELCGLHSFEQVHQLISTVSASVHPEISPVDILRKTFPMGSMTGAPKLSAMQIIERLENHKRGLYSGSVGYFTPEGDFDFNVVIRSILYNEVEKYISFSVGSAITALSDPEAEYEECLLKAAAMRQVLED